MLVHATREGMLNGKLQGIIAMHNPPLTCCFFHIVVEAAGLQKEKKNMLRVRQTFLEIFWSFVLPLRSNCDPELRVSYRGQKTFQKEHSCKYCREDRRPLV